MEFAKELRACRKQLLRDAVAVVFETLLNRSCQSIFLFSTGADSCSPFTVASEVEEQASPKGFGLQPNCRIRCLSEP